MNIEIEVERSGKNFYYVLYCDNEMIIRSPLYKAIASVKSVLVSLAANIVRKDRVSIDGKNFVVRSGNGAKTYGLVDGGKVEEVVAAISDFFEADPHFKHYDGTQFQIIKTVVKPFENTPPIMNICYLDERVEDEMRYSTSGSAGVDCVYYPEFYDSAKIKLSPNEAKIFPLGFKLHIASPNAVGLLFPRGGKGSKGLVLGNLTGVIDSDYTGQVMACLWNRADKDVFVAPYEKVCQLVITPVIKPKFRVISKENFSSMVTARGEKGGINE